jgi:CBS domain-containing protein
MLEVLVAEQEMRAKGRDPQACEQNLGATSLQGARSKGVAQDRREEGTPQLIAASCAPVSSIMTAEVLSFRTTTTVVEATRTMLDRGISGAPVLDGQGKPVGMLSKTDLLEAWHDHGPVAADPEEQQMASAGKATAVPQLCMQGADRAGAGMARAPEAAFGRKEPSVGDIMVPYLLAVPSQAPISLAAALMAYEGVHRLLVLDDSNNMVGIVSALDVLRWLAQLHGFCLPRTTQRQRSAL